ncbi:MAG: P-loop NTPase, partial [Chthoniobacteraceae bacterium]
GAAADKPPVIAGFIPDLAGAIVVTTPSEVASDVVQKSVTYARDIGIKVMGMVENMSGFICPDCGKKYDIFGSGGGQREADRLKAPLLGQVPIDIPTREAGDKGAPIVIADPESAVAKSFADIARKLSTVLPV